MGLAYLTEEPSVGSRRRHSLSWWKRCGIGRNDAGLERFEIERRGYRWNDGCDGLMRQQGITFTVYGRGSSTERSITSSTR